MTWQPTSSAPRLLAGGHERTSRPASRAAPWRAALGGLLGAIARRRERIRDRRLFATLNQRMLRDIGIDRAPAESDGMAWFWRLR